MRNLSRMLFLSIFLILSACAGQAEVTPSPTVSFGDIVITPTKPAENDDVPTSQSPGPVILFAAPDADPARLASVQTELQSSASELGLSLEVRQDLSPASVPTGTVLIVLFGDPPGAVELVPAMPDVAFLADEVGELSASPNLTILGGNSNPTHQAFMAGYIAAVQSDEWRIGIIAANDPDGIQYRKAFLNGAVYFCGPCQPIYPPFEAYPLYIELPDGSGQPAFESAAEQLIAQGVNMLHIAPEHQSDALYQFVAQRGVYLVGTTAPPSGLEGNWVASVIQASGVSIGEAAGLILSGQPVPAPSSGIEISYAGISQARLAHFQSILNKVQSGEIDPVGLED